MNENILHNAYQGNDEAIAAIVDYVDANFKLVKHDAMMKAYIIFSDAKHETEFADYAQVSTPKVDVNDLPDFNEFLAEWKQYEALTKSK
jgi:hypothetical protein